MTMSQNVKITFGMIVLNGEPFLRYNLSSLYPFAHQIIVVEGACPSAAEVASKDGHSIDGTLETLQEFKRYHDPENKLIIVTAEQEGNSNGFWKNKTEMSRAYAQRATGNYLWQVDSDEFYHEEQMKQLIDFLEEKKPDAVSFPTITFWGGLDYIVDSFYLIRDGAAEFHRLFAWAPGYRYETHFPPTVVDEQGVDLRRKFWVRAFQLRRMNIFMYHYSLLLPQQVFSKVRYYKARNKSAIDSWEETVYRRLENPFRAHNVYWHIGWLERFQGEHPAAVQLMMGDIQSGKIQVELRDCQDVEKLLSDRRYVFATKLLRRCAEIMAKQPFYMMYRIFAGLKFRIRKVFTFSHTQSNIRLEE